MMRNFVIKTALCALAATVVWLGVGLRLPPRADAHAVLQRSLPVQNQKLATPPKLVETWFSEPLEQSLTKLKIFDVSGTEVQSGPTQFSRSDPTYAAVPLPSDLAPGIYTAGFENVSTVDGHSWTGSFSFIVLEADGSVPGGAAFQPKAGATQGYLPEIGDTTLRWFEILAAVTITGALIFFILVARPAALFLEQTELAEVEKSSLMLAADLILIAAPLLILASIGQILLLADRLGGPGNIDDILFNTRGGQLWLSRIGLSIALLLLIAPVMYSPAYRSGGRAILIVAVALVGALGLLMTYSLGSHAATGGGEFWSVSSDFVHFLATAAWLGGMMQLPLILWWTRSHLPPTKRLLYLANVFDRYAWLAVISLSLLIGTGVFNGFVQLPNRPALWDTTYGRVLMAKLALILPLLGAAGLNAIFIAPKLSDAIDALENEDDPAFNASAAQRERLEGRLAFLQRILPRTIVAELLLGVAVLVTVAVLTQSTTANGELRQEAGKPSGQYEVSGQAGELTADLLVKPFGIGVSTFAVTLQPAPATVRDISGIRLRAFYDDPTAPLTAGSGGTDQELEPTNQPGVWSADSALLTRPGDWRIEIRVQRRGADDVSTRVNVLAVGGVLALQNKPKGLFDLPFTYVGWNIVAGGSMMALAVGAYLIWRNRPRSWETATSASLVGASVAAFLAGAALVVAVHPGQGGIPRTNPRPATQQSLANGQAIFTQNCMVCHGQDGRGGSGRAADLTQHVPYHNDGTLYTWITSGLPLDSPEKRMPSFKAKLSENERWDVENYLRHAFGSGQFTPVLPSNQPTPGPSGARAP